MSVMWLSPVIILMTLMTMTTIMMTSQFLKSVFYWDADAVPHSHCLQGYQALSSFISVSMETETLAH